VSAELHLEQAVDDVLEAAWPKERNRARVHLATSTLGRVAAFVSALLILGFAVRLVFGLVVPWTFFVFMTGLGLLCARPGEEERTHLLREANKGPRHRPSTGCYPHNGSE